MPRQAIATRRMEPKRRNKDRQWKHRPKVSSNLSKDFPWEVVLRFLGEHSRSLILLQMVDKNLRHLITTDDKLWLSIFKREIKSHAYCVRSVNDPIYPSLRLWKPHITGLPVYSGVLRGDIDEANLPFGFDVCFTSYVRRVFALKHGMRCGMCGCRYRHEPYWSLRMRVCRLCMEGNTISSDLLSTKYGVDHSEMLVQHKGEFFFYPCNTAMSDDRCSLHGMTKHDALSKGSTHMFWLPHLRKFLDFQALFQRQQERRKAAVVLSNAVKKRWMIAQQSLFAAQKSHYSIDCLMAVLYRNEKKRFVNAYKGISNTGGPLWSFPEHPRSGQKLQARTGVCSSQYSRLVAEFEDCIAREVE